MNGRLFEPNFSNVAMPPPRACQTRAIEQLREGYRAGHRQQILVMPTGSGKCLGRDTPVLMADGTIRAVQDVKVGDQLLGPDGAARNVLSVATGREQLYRVIPKKGMSYVCNASHILSLRKTPGSDALTLANGDRVPPAADVVNVNVEVFAASNKTARHCLKGWRAGPVEFPTEHYDLVLDPYLLGCWLGDGTQNRFAISKPPSQMVDEWRASAARFGYEVMETRTGEHGCPTWTIVSRDNANLYLMMLDTYGLRERKHIPHDYKVAPLAARLEVLAGLIDSDGHMSHSGFDWINSSQELAEDFAFVCRSVGLAAYVQPCRKGIKSIGFEGKYWRVSVSGDCSIIPCRDKAAPKRRQKKRHLVHGIRVEPIDEGEYFGFEIDGDHLFMLGDFTVTHNTITAMMLIHESLKKGKRATFVCDRTALINQTSAVADSLGLTSHAIIQANHPRRDTGLPLQIASIQTIQARGYWPQSDLVVLDECFPAGTQILMSDGSSRFIENIVAGDQIFSALGPDVVDSTFCKRAISLVRVRLSNGTEFRCTADHPIFTNSGWVPAAELEKRQRLFGIQTMRAVWQRIQAEADSISKQLPRGRARVLDPQVLLEVLLMECAQPDEIGEVHQQDAGNASDYWAPTKITRREREAATADTAENATGSRRRVGAGIHRANEKGPREWLSHALQDRLGEQGFAHRVGTRWGQSLREIAARAGCSKGCITEAVWVESVTPEECRGGTPVYNLRVKHHPSYFANGVLVHNCHTVYAAAKELLEQRTVPVLGLTATPCTAGLGKLYSHVVNAATMDELTRDGILVPLRILTCITPDMAGAKTSGGEWTSKAASERELTIIGDVVAEWVKHGEGRKTIAFGAGITYCEELVRRFNEIGVNAACYTSDTPDDERSVLVREFSKPNSAIRILVSVSALAKGFDVKDVGCIIDARPLRKSLSEVIQMWGRGLRSSPETGKSDCVLLDHSGNALRFHDDFTDVYFNGFGDLSSAEKMDAKPRQEPEDWEPTGCPQCHRKPFRKRCLACGFEKPSQTLIDSTPGQMEEIMIGKKQAATSKADLWAQLCTYARWHLKTEKKSGWAWYKYQEITGEKPPRSFSFDSTCDVSISPALIGKLKSMRIAYGRRRTA